MTDLSWLPLDAALAHVGVDPANTETAAAVDNARKAAARYVERHRPDLLVVDDLDVETFTADEDTLLGALMLTARLHARKGSPVGLASFSEFGPAQVVRFDSDIERLLRLGRYAPPAVG